MHDFPQTQQTPLVRTDFSNESVWQKIVETLSQESEDGFRADVHIVDDPAFHDANIGIIAEKIRKANAHSLVFVVDARTVGDEEHTVLCINVDNPSRGLRVVLSALWAVENNLSIANMDFDDFVEAADPDGVFRGFKTAS